MSPESRQHILWFRNSAPYINAHRGKTFVLMFGGEAAQHPNFPNIIHDIALLNSLGVRLILIHGSRPQIEARLQAAGQESNFHDGVRVTDANALEHVKDAAGSLRAQIEALLSMGLPNSPMLGASIRVCGGNFVTARPIGVVDGIDFQHTGRVRNIDATGIRANLDAGSIVLLSPLGYSPTGEIFNLSLEDIAVHTAAATGADQLLLFGAAPGFMDNDGNLVRQCDLRQALELTRNPAADPEQLRLLHTARQGCTAGVARCQIISYAENCALLEELFTHDGSGTLVGNDDYEQARLATIDDVGGILELIEPLEVEGVLVKRSRELLETEISHFRILERDGRIIACAALYPYQESSCGEIACIVTHPDYRGSQRGERLLSELVTDATRLGLQQVFVLTTQTAHWFLEQGFVETQLSQLPEQKQSLYNLQRNSKVLIKPLS
jgi:amino-acid N-acetyltransferase